MFVAAAHLMLSIRDTVDNTTAGGFFAWMGREPAQSGRGVHAGADLGTTTLAG